MENEKELSTLEKAEQLHKKLTESNMKFEELVARQEKAKIDDMLGGKSKGSQPEPKPKQPISNRDFAKAFQRGDVKLNSDVPLVDVL
jgi:hypothetical protein